MPLSKKKVEEIWANNYSAVKSRIMAKVADPTIAEDIAGDVFLGLLELSSSGTMRNEAKAETVLFSITTNKIYDWMRQKYREQPTDVSRLRFPEESSSSLFSSASYCAPQRVAGDYEAKEFSDHVMESASSLTDREQQAFMLMVVNGMTRFETAERMSVSATRVQQLVKTAKEKIADDLAKAYFPETDSGQGELGMWADKFFNAYLRLALKTGRLTDDLENQARDAWIKIKEKLEA
jgi:RNA polymerase sigma factor (sigma-70 family)